MTQLPRGGAGWWRIPGFQFPRFGPGLPPTAGGPPTPFGTRSSLDRKTDTDDGVYGLLEKGHLTMSLGGKGLQKCHLSSVGVTPWNQSQVAGWGRAKLSEVWKKKIYWVGNTNFFLFLALLSVDTVFPLFVSVTTEGLGRRCHHFGVVPSPSFLNDQMNFAAFTKLHVQLPYKRQRGVRGGNRVGV